jgi:hypothetical protein
VRDVLRTEKATAERTPASYLVNLGVASELELDTLRPEAEEA